MLALVRPGCFRIGLSLGRPLAECLLQKPNSCLCSNYYTTGKYKSLLQITQAAVGTQLSISNGAKQYSSSTVDDKTHVYHGNLTPQIRMVKIFSLCSSIAGLAAQPILYNHSSELGGTGVVIAVATFVGFFTFVTPLLLHLLTRKYVTDIHYDSASGMYTATLLSFFLRMKTISFKSEDVQVPDVPGLFTSFIVKKTPLFIDPRQFEDPAHYGKLMGYDKPIDYLLKKEPLKNEKTHKM